MMLASWGGRVTALVQAPSLSVFCGVPRAATAVLQAACTVSVRSGGHALESARAAEGLTDLPAVPRPGDAAEAEFSAMLEALGAWKALYFDCIVPRKVRYRHRYPPPPPPPPARPMAVALFLLVSLLR